MKTWIKEKEIIELLKNRKWSIGFSHGFSGCYYQLQKGKLGYGGETKRLHSKTFWAMHRKGLLKKINKEEFGTQEFILKGRKIK